MIVTDKYSVHRHLEAEVVYVSTIRPRRTFTREQGEDSMTRIPRVLVGLGVSALRTLVLRVTPM